MITDQIGLYSVLLPLFIYMVRETQAFFSNLSLFQNSYMKKRSVSVCIDFSFVASLVQNIGQPYSTVFFFCLVFLNLIFFLIPSRTTVRISLLLLWGIDLKIRRSNSWSLGIMGNLDKLAWTSVSGILSRFF